MNIVHVLELELEAYCPDFQGWARALQIGEIKLEIGDEFLDCEFVFWGSTPTAAARGVVSVRRKDGS